MKMKLKKYRFIFLLVILLMGLSITGWSVSANYDYASINNELQAALTNDRQIGDTKLGDFSNNIPILFLISIGLIGLFSVRRQTKKIDKNTPSRRNK